MAVVLRPYQLEAIAEARAYVNAGKRAPLIVMPCGGGKTRVGSEIVRSHIAMGGKVLWLAHRAELVDQAVSSLVDAGLTVGVIAAQSKHRPNPFAQIQVASIQTILSRGTDFLPTLIVFDECHFAVATEWSTTLTRFPSALRIGLTATPERLDGLGLGGLFDCIVVGATIRLLTELGHLLPLDVIAPDRMLPSKEIAQKPSDAYMAHASGKQAVVFAPHVRAAHEFAAEFRAAGIPTGVVTGDLAIGERHRVLDDYERGRTMVLCNVGVLTVGWDSPRTSVCILARGCGSPGLYIQICGRVLRPYKGKDRALLIDLRGVVHVHGRPDEDREYSLEGRGIRRIGADLGPERFCPVCKELMDPGATVCEMCGKAREPLKAPTVTGDRLHIYARDILAKDTADKRVQRLAKWIRDGAERGYKPGWAAAKYKSLYGDWPSRSDLERAKGAA